MAGLFGAEVDRLAPLLTVCFCALCLLLVLIFFLRGERLSLEKVEGEVVPRGERSSVAAAAKDRRHTHGVTLSTRPGGRAGGGGWNARGSRLIVS